MIKIAVIDAGVYEPAYETVSSRFPHIELTHVEPEERIDGFDAAVIHSSDKKRFELAQKTALAGKHILVASPVAENSEQASELIDTCRRQGVTLMAGQSKRFAPSQVVMKSTLAAGKLGDAGLLRIHLWQSKTAEDPFISAEFIAGVDLANWYFEKLPDTVYALKREGYLQTHLGFADGGMALVDIASSLPQGDCYESISLIGGTGAAYSDDHHNRNLLFAGGIPTAMNTGEGDNYLVNQIHEFVAAIKEQRQPTISGEAGRQALVVAEAAKASARSETSMTLAGDIYEPA